MKTRHRNLVLASYVVIFATWFAHWHWLDGPERASAQLGAREAPRQVSGPTTVSALQLQVTELKHQVQELQSVIRVSSGKVEIKTDKPLLEISGNSLKFKSNLNLEIQGGAMAAVKAGVIRLN